MCRGADSGNLLVWEGKPRQAERKRQDIGRQNMKKIMMAAMVSLVMSGAASAAGYGLEGARMEGGLKFAERQISSKFNSDSSPVRLAGEFAPVVAAKCNAEARDYNKLTVKAPPALKSEQDMKGSEGKTPEKKGAIAGGIVGGVLASPIVISALPAVALLGTGIGFLAVGPIATAAIVAVGAVAAGAAIGYGIGCLVK